MYTIQAYNSDMENEWDLFCTKSYMATFLHTRRFLSYHGSTFTDQSLIVKKESTIVGVLPAGCFSGDDNTVHSHPGATYGGMIHQGELSGINMLYALEMVIQYFSDNGFQSFIYKVIPSFYHVAPAQDDLYALFRLGAKRLRCDLSAIIELSNRLTVSKRRTRSLKKSIKSGVVVEDGLAHVEALWKVLSENLSTKHEAKPVHSLDEILLLKHRFPNEIEFVVGLLDNEVVAGLVLFNSKTTCHAQYIASNTIGYSVSALDTVFDYAINRAKNNNYRYFDFGVSNEDSGMILNEGLFKFKSEFGSGSAVHEFYELSLK